jgi:hypothetical protein
MNSKGTGDGVSITSGSCPDFICIDLLLCIVDMSLTDNDEESPTTVDHTKRRG